MSIFQRLLTASCLVSAVALSSGRIEAQTTFTGCGVLIQGFPCVLLEVPTGAQYILENTAGFSPGDVVLVAGILELGCISICLQGDGCIFDNTIDVCGPPVPSFVRGDVNQDGQFDIADAVAGLNILFVPGTPAGTCTDSRDANDDGLHNIADAIYTLSAQFSSGPLPPSPFPACGPDPTADALDCVAFTPCP